MNKYTTIEFLTEHIIVNIKDEEAEFNIKNCIILKRKIYKENSTIGNLIYENKKICDTLEDVYRENLTKETKIKHKTAIPIGVYKIKLEYSEKFKDILIELINVPLFEEIKIHIGNTISDTSGCILVGDYHKTGTLINSRIALNKTKKTIYKKIKLEIIKYIIVY